jgi:hypothetical protein
LYIRLAQVAIAEKAVRNILVPPPPESVMRRELEPRMISAILGNKGATIRYAAEPLHAWLEPITAGSLSAKNRIEFDSQCLICWHRVLQCTACNVPNTRAARFKTSRAQSSTLSAATRSTCPSRAARCRLVNFSYAPATRHKRRLLVLRISLVL